MQLQVWLTSRDECVLSSLFRDELPTIGFIDDNVWECSPVVRVDLPSCMSSFVYLWSPQLTENLPIRHRADGRIEGPTAGVVVQYLRCQVRQDVLASGRFAAGSSNPTAEYKDFVATLWRVLRRYCRSVDAVNPATGDVITPSVRDMLVGGDAAEMTSGGGLSPLKYRSTENYYLPSKR